MISAPFTLASVPSADRYQALRQAMRNSPIPIDLNARTVSNVHAFNNVSAIGAIQVHDSGMCGVDGTFRRSGGPVGGSGRTVTAHLITDGALDFEQAGHHAHATVGDIVFTSTTHPLTVQQRSHSRKLSYVVDFDELQVPLQIVTSMLAVRLGPNHPIAPVVASYLRSIVASSAGPRARSAMHQPTIEMLRSLVSVSVGGWAPAGEASAISLGDRIMDYARLHLFDEDLSAPRIARAHGISVRYLYSTLARQEVSLGDWIREQRVESAARLLADPQQPGLTIATAAQLAGFSDQAHFARVFRRVKGVSPREWRGSSGQMATP